jgi:hypothetical protein
MYRYVVCIVISLGMTLCRYDVCVINFCQAFCILIKTVIIVLLISLHLSTAYSQTNVFNLFGNTIQTVFNTL